MKAKFPPNFERLPIDLPSLMAFLDQFGDVKAHLMRGGAEFLRALKVLLDQLVRALENEFPNKRQTYEFLYALQYGLGYLTARLPVMESSEDFSHHVTEAKRSALRSILGVMDQEVKRLEKIAATSEHQDAAIS